MGGRDIIHGDVFDEFGDLESDSAHAAIVDYPWELMIKTSAGKEEFRNSTRAANQGFRDPDSDKVMFDMLDGERIVEVFEELHRVLVEGGYVICFADDRFQEVVREAMRESPLILRRNWAWTPNQIGMGYYGRVNHYPLPVATNGETERYVNDRGTLYEVDSRNDNDYHTSKPVELYRKLLQPPVLEEGERLLEPFCGSAPGAAVAVERDLDYWGADISEEAVELARERLQQRSLSSFSDGKTSLDDF